MYCLCSVNKGANLRLCFHVFKKQHGPFYGRLTGHIGTICRDKNWSIKHFAMKEMDSWLYKSYYNLCHLFIIEPRHE